MATRNWTNSGYENVRGLDKLPDFRSQVDPGLPEPPKADPKEKPIWSGHLPPPAIGSTVTCRIGPALVRHYFIEYGYLGVELELTDPPEWWRKQNKAGALACPFGAELR